MGNEESRTVINDATIVMLYWLVQMMQKYCKRLSFLHKAYDTKSSVCYDDRADIQKMILDSGERKKSEHDDGVIHQSNTLHNFIIPPKQFHSNGNIYNIGNFRMQNMNCGLQILDFNVKRSVIRIYDYISVFHFYASN